MKSRNDCLNNVLISKLRQNTPNEYTLGVVLTNLLAVMIALFSAIVIFLVSSRKRLLVKMDQMKSKTLNERQQFLVKLRNSTLNKQS
jgi:hypothetical protein